MPGMGRIQGTPSTPPARIVRDDTPRGRRPEGELVPQGLQTAAAYSWRLVAVGIAVYIAFLVLSHFQVIGVPIFIALVMTTVLRPLADTFNRWLPRTPAVLMAYFSAILFLAALLGLVGNSVAGESGRLGSEFQGGIGQIERWLERPPFRISHRALTGLQGKLSDFVSTHRATLISQALSGATRAFEIVAGLALALFCSIFFIHSGDRMWHWFQAELPEAVRPRWDRAGQAAWHSFAGYTRGIIIVAGVNAVLVGVALFVLHVPLALPLTLLEFFASFIPLVGSPIALAVATVVALAGRGPLTAGLVLVLIVVIGQIEGHILHPLVMSWAVRLHPIVVAVSVLGGAVVAGIFGAVLAVPFVSVGWAVYRELRVDQPPVA